MDLHLLDTWRLNKYKTHAWKGKALKDLGVISEDISRAVVINMTECLVIQMWVEIRDNIGCIWTEEWYE